MCHYVVKGFLCVLKVLIPAKPFLPGQQDSIVLWERQVENSSATSHFLSLKIGKNLIKIKFLLSEKKVKNQLLTYRLTFGNVNNIPWVLPLLIIAKYLPQFDYNFILEDSKKSFIEERISLFQGFIKVLILASRFLVLIEISAKLLLYSCFFFFS